MMVTANGFFEGRDHDISWHNADSMEFRDFAIQQLDETDLIVFGRSTYEMMASFWPSDMARRLDPETAQRMNSKQKLIFTTTPLGIRWQNVEVSDNVPVRMRELKEQPGGDIIVLGSSGLCITLLKENLLDEVRVMVNPVVLDSGTPLFHGINQPYNFELQRMRPFNDGNVLLTYKVIK